MKCKTCAATVKKLNLPEDLAEDATHIANAGTVEWPVCAEHMQLAMVAGWFPITEAPNNQ